MKYLQRYLSLLFALVMCVGMFSITAHAEEVTTKALSFSAWSYLEDSTSSWESGTYTATNPFTYAFPNSTGAGISRQVTISGLTAKDYVHTYHLVVENTDGTPILKQNDAECNLALHDVYYSFLVTNMSNKSVYYRSPSSIKALVYYVYGGSEYFDVMEYKVNGTALNLDLDICPSDDVSKIEFIIKQEFNSTIKNVTFYLGAIKNDDFTFPYVITDEPTKEEGLLSGLIGWVKNIFNKISDIGSAIVELPNKLWDKISEGLKNLFVPSEESMTAYKDKWDELLSSRFGAVYQVCDIVTNSWSEIGNADTTDTIKFPSVVLDLPDNAQFAFGGYDVKVVPDGFDVLVQAVKLLVGIVCTLAFINGMLRKYDELMGVEK